MPTMSIFGGALSGLKCRVVGWVVGNYNAPISMLEGPGFRSKKQTGQNRIAGSMLEEGGFARLGR